MYFKEKHRILSYIRLTHFEHSIHYFLGRLHLGNISTSDFQLIQYNFIIGIRTEWMYANVDPDWLASFEPGII